MKINRFTVFFIFIILACLLEYHFVYKKFFVNNPIKSDAAGYYAYLPAFFLYGDFGFKNISTYLPDYKSLNFPAIQQNINTTRNFNKYPMGVSILLLPFFILATLVSVITKLPLSGYTNIYQYTMGLAGTFYLILGLFFLKKLYLKYFSRDVVFLTLIGLVFATNLYHYATYDGLMSHIFSFCLLAIYLFTFDKWRNKVTLINSLIIGLCLGLMFLVRNVNILWIILLFVNLRNNFKYFPMILSMIFITVLPQLLYWQYAFGSWLIFSYQGEYFNFLKPSLYGVLLSPRKGLFFWSPVFFLGLLGIKNLSKKIKYLPWLIIIILINVYLISAWHDWSFGASFGHRAFIDIYPALGLFLAASFEKAYKNSLFKKIVLFLLTIFIMINLTNMFKYWQHIFPYDQISLNIYLEKMFVLFR